MFPDKLKIAKVVPLYKKDDKTLITNYRPVSIPPTISKVIEKIMFRQIYEYFTINNLFYKSQYGFRQKHSTEFAAYELLDRVICDLDKGETPFCVFLDLSKAFDTNNHSILLHKLNYYGFRRGSLNLLNSYLSNRKQYVQFGGTKSSLSKIMTGVPQGSILGSLLFIIYMNDINKASSILRLLIYADDTTLYSTIFDFKSRDTKIISSLINVELDKINEWLIANKLSLNVKKSKFMLFHMPQKSIQKPKLNIGKSLLECVDCFNFLGIHFDKHLSWNEHIHTISNKITKTIGILNKLKHHIPLNILITIYNTLILPHINYGMLSWGFESDRILKLQKKVVRIITLSKFNAHSERIFKRLNVLKVIIFGYKLQHKNLPAYFNNFKLTPFSHIHNHSTRNRNLLCPERVYHEFAKHNVRHERMNILNTFPVDITSKIHTHSLSGYVTYIKTYKKLF